ncbi:MAG: EamA family transporter [Ruminococcus sp.]|nr:EamA family transporter [Ruminococcus sp.]
MKRSVKPYLLLLAVVFGYSFGGVFSKLAAREPFLSVKWILLYGCLIAILGLYAIFWQQILRRVPLNIAYICKSVGIVFSMTWGIVFFRERISPVSLLGGGIVILGVILILTGGKEHE